MVSAVPPVLSAADFIVHAKSAPKIQLLIWQIRTWYKRIRCLSGHGVRIEVKEGGGEVAISFDILKNFIFTEILFHIRENS